MKITLDGCASDQSNDLFYDDFHQTASNFFRSMRSKNYNLTERCNKNQLDIVKPLLAIDKENPDWNCAELEKLQRRFSELIDGKTNDDRILPINNAQLIERIESLYSSMGSHIHVSPCLVRLYILTDFEVCSLEQWKLIRQGYPLWLFNTGFNPRRCCELRFMLADEKTGFILWSDRVTSTSNIIQPTDFTLSFRHSSNNSSIMLRFKSNDEKSFAGFYSYLKQNRFYAENLLNQKIGKRFIKKSDISPPCHFKHFNHIEENIKDVHHLFG